MKKVGRFLILISFLISYLQDAVEDEAGKIEVSWLDGSHRKVFLGEDIIWPNGLSIDDIG